MENYREAQQTRSETVPTSICWEQAVNSRPRPKACRPSRWCRDLRCDHCAEIHRKHFITEVNRQHSKVPYAWFVTIDFRGPIDFTVWSKLAMMSRSWTKAHGASPGPNFRVLAVGGAHGHPHLHVVGSEQYGSTIARRLGVDLTEGSHEITLGTMKVNLVIKAIDDIEGLAGYLFDKNYRVTATHPDKPPRLRLLTSSKGPKLGFPSWKKVRPAAISSNSEVKLCTPA